VTFEDQQLIPSRTSGWHNLVCFFK